MITFAISLANTENRKKNYIHDFIILYNFTLASTQPRYFYFAYALNNVEKLITNGIKTNM